MQRRSRWPLLLPHPSYCSPLALPVEFSFLLRFLRGGEVCGARIGQKVPLALAAEGREATPLCGGSGVRELARDGTRLQQWEARLHEIAKAETASDGKARDRKRSRCSRRCESIRNNEGGRTMLHRAVSLASCSSCSTSPPIQAAHALAAMHGPRSHAAVGAAAACRALVPALADRLRKVVSERNT